MAAAGASVLGTGWQAWPTAASASHTPRLVSHLLQRPLPPQHRSQASTSSQEYGADTRGGVESQQGEAAGFDYHQWRRVSRKTEVLDMQSLIQAYLQTQQDLDLRMNPASVSLNRRIHHSIASCNSQEQLESVVARELPAMHSGSVAAAMRAIVSFIQAGSDATLVQQQQHGDEQQPNSSAEAPHPGADTGKLTSAVTLTVQLMGRMVELCKEGSGITISHVTSAIYCASYVSHALSRATHRTVHPRNAAIFPSTDDTDTPGLLAPTTVNGHSHDLPVSGPAEALPDSTVVATDTRPVHSSSGNSNSSTPSFTGFKPSLTGSSQLPQLRQQYHSCLQRQLPVLLEHTQSALFLASPNTLQQLILDIRRLGVPVGRVWLRDYCKVVQSKMSVTDPGQLVRITLALARLGHAPDAYWLATLRDTLTPHLTTLTTPSLSALLVAWARWQTDPGEAFRSEVCRRLAADLKSADAGNLVGAVHALHKLDHAFSTTWLQAVLERVLDLRSTLTPVQDVELLSTLASLNWAPPEPMMSALVSAIQQRLPAYPPDCLTLLLRALSLLGFRPSSPWMEEWLLSSRRQLRALHPTALATSLHALSRLRVHLPSEWTQEALTLCSSQAKADGYLPHEAAVVLISMSHLRMTPSRNLLRDLLRIMGSQAAVQKGINTLASKSSDVSVLGDGGSGPSLRPPTSMAQLPDQQQHQRPGALTSPTSTAQLKVLQQVADAVCALPDMLARYDADAVRASAPDKALPPSKGSQPGTAGGITSNPGSPSLAPDQADSSEQHLPGSAGTSDSERHPCAKVVPLMLPAAEFGSVLSVLRPHLPQLGSLRLYKLLRALSHMRVNPGSRFLSAHLEAITPHLRSMSRTEKENLDEHYRLLASSIRRQRQGEEHQAASQP